MIHLAGLVAAALYATQAVNAQAQHWGQCGGNGWSGPTTCVSPYVCTKLNDWYYQCLDGPSTTSSSTKTTSSTKPMSSSSTRSSTSTPPSSSTSKSSTSSSSSTSISSSSSSSSSSATPSSTGLSGLPYLKGVNEAGYDFTVYTNGSFSGIGYAPPAAQFSHFASQGVNIFRVPFAWQLMTPTLGGTIDSTFFSRYDTTVQQGLATGAYVILDLHNYARWNGQIINQGGPTIAQYTSLWSQVAAKYKDNSKIIFGIMNEPHDLPAIAPWVQSVQGAVNAIRAAGATSQVILIPGSSWSSAQALPTEAGPQLLTVTDPAGGVSKLVFDVHKYLDSDNSGTHTECTTDNVSVFQTLVAWLKQNNRQAILSETGGGNTQSCITAVKSQLAYIKSAYPSMLGFTMWSAGSFDTKYELTLTPNADGSDQILWTQAVVPNF